MKEDKWMAAYVSLFDGEMVIAQFSAPSGEERLSVLRRGLAAALAKSGFESGGETIFADAQDEEEFMDEVASMDAVFGIEQLP